MQNNNLGNRIAEARKKINLSQAQLAERLFISSQAVGKWERGESMPDITTLNRLTEIFGVDLNYFSENTQPITNESATENLTKKLETESTTIQQNKKSSWDMSQMNLIDNDFSGLKNLNEKLSGSNMKGCKFIGSDLSELLLKNNNVESCDFSDSQINNSQIQNSNLDKNVFKNCSLNQTEFLKSNIGNCDFSEANFTGVKFKSSSFLENNAVQPVTLLLIK